MSNDIRSKFITLPEPTSTNKIVIGRGGNGSDIIQLQSYLTEGSNTGLVQRAWGGEAADIFNVNYELPDDGTVGIDFNTGNLKAMAEMLVEPDWEVTEKRIAIDTAQAVIGFGIDVAAAAAGAIPIIGDGGAGVAGAGANLALDLATIAGHAALDIEEYNNNLAGIDEFFDDPKRQDWGTVNIRDARTVVEIRDFQVGVDTITLPSLPKGWVWQTDTGSFSNGRNFVSLSFKNSTNSSNEILRIGFDKYSSENTKNERLLINNLLVKSNSGQTIGKTLKNRTSVSGSSEDGTLVNDFLYIADDNVNKDDETVKLFGFRGDDILIGRLNGNDALKGGSGNDYIQPGYGDDTIDGGKGYDRVDYSNRTDKMTIDPSIFDDKFQSIEGIIATEFNDNIDFSSLELSQEQIDEVEIVGLFSLEGRGGNDTLQGSRYGDFIDGGQGTDTMIGGEGNDVYIVDESSDVVIERADRGTDKIESTLINFSLENLPHVENLTLKGGITNTPQLMFGKGNAADNILKVNDISSPGMISATLFGNDGNDTISGGADSDLLYGGADDDYLYGEIGNDSLYGGADDDTLNGGASAETSYFGETIIAEDNDFTVNDYGWASFDKYPRQLADVNGDGRADIVAFGLDAVYTALGQADGTFGESIEAKNDDFTVNDQNYGEGWKSFDKNPRQLGDVNGDGRADIVGFANESVGVSFGRADGTFSPVILAKDSNFTVNEYNSVEGGKSFNKNPRQVADVDGDGHADIVGFADETVAVAYGRADGTFSISNGTAKDNDFTPVKGGYESFDKYPRQVADVNGDGIADIVAFGLDAVYTALGEVNDGTTPLEFGETIEARNDDFTVNDANYGIGWSSFDKYPRQVADVNGDGRADIVGFADDSVGFALGQEDGTFGSVILAIEDDFTVKDGGWESFDRNPRQVADVNGDGLADIVGFDDDEIKVSLAINAKDDVLTGGEGADTFEFDSFDSLGRSFDVITDFSHVEGDKIKIGSEFGTTSRDQFSYDSGNGWLSFDDNHFATLNTDSGFQISEDIVF